MDFSGWTIDDWITVVLIVYGNLALFYALAWWSKRAARSGSTHIAFGNAHSGYIYNWLKKNTKDKKGERYRDIDEIAKELNITREQVRRGCFYSGGLIHTVENTNKERWTIYPEEN